MSEEKDGGSAFPQIGTNLERLFEDDTNGDLYPIVSSSGGMSLRDWFAGMALQGIYSCAVGYAGVNTAEERTIYAYEVADAMLKARVAK